MRKIVPHRPQRSPSHKIVGAGVSAGPKPGTRKKVSDGVHPCAASFTVVEVIRRVGRLIQSAHPLMEVLAVFEVTGRVGHVEGFLLVGEFPDRPRGNTHRELVRRDDTSRNYHCPCRHPGALLDHRPIQNERADSDKRVVVDRASMKHGPVSDDDVVPYGEGEAASGDVEHAMILNVGCMAYANGIYVPAGDRIEPEIRSVTYLDVSQDDHAGGQKYVFAQARPGSSVFVEHVLLPAAHGYSVGPFIASLAGIRSRVP